MREIAKPYPDEPDADDDEKMFYSMLIGSIPLVGSAGEKYFARLITPSLDRRRSDWFNDLARDFRRLASRVEGIGPELFSSDGFVDAITQAATSAVKTSNREKREALRNAVLNSAKGSLGEHKQAVFLFAVDSLTPLHLEVLKFFHNPSAWFLQPGLTAPQVDLSGNLMRILHAAFPHLKGESILSLAYGDLADRGYIEANDLHTQIGRHVYRPTTTPLGREFLAFVSEPPELQESGETPEPQA